MLGTTRDDPLALEPSPETGVDSDAPVPKRQPQGPVSPMEIVIKELQAHESIPGVIPFGERVRLAGERIKPIAQHPVEPFHRSHMQASSRTVTALILITLSALVGQIAQIQKWHR